MKDSKSVTINHQSVEMTQPTVQSNLVSFFSTKVIRISHKCENVTYTPSAHILPDRSATLNEPRPDIPRNCQKESEDTPSDRVYDEDGRTDLQKFFNLYPDEDQEDIAINTFLAECKKAKYAHFNQTFASYSVYEPNLDEIVNRDAEKQSIIPEEGSPCPKPNVAHLSPSNQDRINKIVAAMTNFSVGQNTI